MTDSTEEKIAANILEWGISVPDIASRIANAIRAAEAEGAERERNRALSICDTLAHEQGESEDYRNGAFNCHERIRLPELWIKPAKEADAD